MDMITAFILAWLSTLSGVALGGFLVYRTKKESYEPLFAKQPEGDSFNVDDISEMQEQVSTATIPTAVHQANSAFIDQFADDLLNKVDKDGR